MKIRTGLGRSCRRFVSEESMKVCVIGGLTFEDVPGLAADSDGDVVFQSIVHAIGTLVGHPLMSLIADTLCYKQGITDSQAYVEEALKYLKNQKIEHVAFVIEAREPAIVKVYDKMVAKIAQTLSLDKSQVGISVISGEGLSDVACGEGVEATCLLTTCED